MRRSLLFLFLCIGLACASRRSFDKCPAPPAPDYADLKNWIALPFRADAGDTVPPGKDIKDGQALAEADVFYIHPTVYLTAKQWNADLSWADINKKCDDCVRYQASAFNACCRVYAPRYRQAALKSFFDTVKTDGKRALALAYSDVKRAFEYYLKNYNNGRPIIIAGHSQGAAHSASLLKEFFDGKPLMKQLVAAYPIGFPAKVKEFVTIPLADSAAQTGCFVTWNTVVWGTKPEKNFARYKNSACVNPLTWRRDTVYAPASMNKGGLPFGFKQIDPAVCDAKCYSGVLWVHRPSAKRYYGMAKSYHLVDVNLFYMNIRENACQRVKAFLEAGKR